MTGDYGREDGSVAQMERFAAEVAPAVRAMVGDERA